MQAFYSYSFEDLKKIFADNELSSGNPSLLFNWHYKKNKTTPCELFGISQKTKAFVKENFHFNRPEIETVHVSMDKTVKFLFRLQDGYKVETVLIPFQHKYTVCLSSQVGCAMNCAFCFTGTQGLSRNLTADEIIGQFMQVQTWLSENRPGDDRILNIVYMGQGEPLHNFDAVKKSAEIFMSQHGLSLAGHKITISTSGYIPGLKRWNKEMPDVNIALSLHSAFPEKRSRLIPINKKFPVDQVVELVETFPKGKKRFVTYEYLLLKDVNDSDEDAHATGALLRDKKALINLIPFNPFPGSEFRRPDSDVVQLFKQILDGYKIPTMIRTTKGDEILAACGQLNSVK